ncbi:Penicillin amidase [Novymonas esmeraldas]|uniref:Penicillin amidase n=1 Tax=Novymonas esmeraldas TaxID=1808958 RepID=A0AAW0EUK4_9TRYP
MADTEEHAKSGAAGEHEPVHPRVDDPDGSDRRAGDAEEASSTSAGVRQMLGEKTEVSARDRACNVVAVFLLFAILVTSIISIAAGACCLASLSGKTFQRFPLFFAFGVAPVVVGCLCLLLVVAVMVFIGVCAMGLTNYGMCCYGTTRCRGALRVCLLGVFPFVVFLVLVAMCILGFSFFSLSQQLPPFDKNYTAVEGLSGPIQIVRDENGLTHIKASSRRDAYLGQGFAEAQDRLFQLEFHRLVGKGELSSVVGEDGVATDSSMRTLNLRKAAYAMCRITDPAYVDYLEAFAEGVNLYLQRVSKRPVEFFFMGDRPLYFHNPKPFSAIDVCLTARVFQWQMSSNIAGEGRRFSIWAGTNRTYAETAELYPDFTDQPNTILTQAQMLALTEPQWNTSTSGPLTEEETVALQTAYMTRNARALAYSSAAEAAVYDNIMAALRAQLQSAAAAGGAVSNGRATSNIVSLHLGDEAPGTADSARRARLRDLSDRTVFAFRFIHASNAWAARDASGNAMVASDPHLTINQPSVWYYVHLSFPTSDGIPFDAAGVALVGIPGVHIGRTTHIAWGITMSLTDLQDLFVFPPTSLSGLPENTYMYAGKQRTFVDRVERVKVKGKKDVVLHVQDTILGPVVSDMLGMPSALKVALFAVPLRENDNTSIIALMQLASPAIDTAAKMVQNLHLLRSPGFSIPIADVQGNLGYTVTGEHPLRPAGHTGLVPTLALDGPDLLCRILMVAAGTPVADAAPCDLASAMASPGVGGAAASPSSLNLTAVMPLIRRRLQTSTWSTYVPVTADAAFTSVPVTLLPQVSMPFDGTAASISCANQKVVPQGYPYLLGADYAWPYRGARVQSMLASNAANLSSQRVHMDIQMDHRSNIWAVELQPIVSDPRFAAGIGAVELATYWAGRLLAWDGMAVVGSVEAAFLWRWLQRMSILPRDALRAIKAAHWHPINRYITRMLTSPSARMTAECADYQHNWTSAAPCWDFATAMFLAQAQAAGKGYAERWGIDLNRMHGLHEMLSKKIIHPVFQREIQKAGDSSSVAVSHNSVDGAMPSTAASSMRQLYDMWNATTRVYFQLPAGNSGNPYSKFYDNMLYLFEKEQYVHVVTDHTSWDEISVLHSQTLSQ